MIDGFVSISLRPIKIAFLVRPADRRALDYAFRVSSRLWGGVFNPIIPTYRTRPRNWDELKASNPSPRDIIEGYLACYDPDVIFAVGNLSPALTTDLGRLVRYVWPIPAPLNGSDLRQFGTAVGELLDHLTRRERDFEPSKPLRICTPSYGRNFRAFFSALYGPHPVELGGPDAGNLTQRIEFEERTCTVSNYLEVAAADCLTPIALGKTYGSILEVNWERRCLMVLDGSSLLDIIDYWNLRALGWDVIPVLKQAAEIRSISDLAVRMLARQNSHRRRERVFDSTYVYKGRCVQNDEFRKSFETLQASQAKLGDANLESLTPVYYPRVWEKGEEESGTFEADSAREKIVASDTSLKFPALAPKFITERRLSEGSFSNHLAFYTWSAHELLAEVFPVDNEEVARSLRLTGSYGLWRTSKQGLVHIADELSGDILMAIPSGERVFTSWMASRGWKAQLSDSGRVAKQMLKHLGGVWGIQLLANRHLLEFVDGLSGDRMINLEACLGRMTEIVNKAGLEIGPIDLIDDLVEKNMLRLGLQIRCPRCGRRSWYSVDAVTYDVQCPLCLEVFPIPSIPSPAEQSLIWAYKSFGPFNVGGHGEGAYSVLLTLRFFTKALRAKATPMLSFDAQWHSLSIELDLGLLIRLPGYAERAVHPVFVECKSFNTFDAVDRDRMLLVGSHFPESLIVFSTLNEKLRKDEKALIRDLLNEKADHHSDGRRQGGVLVLTGHELFSDESVPKCWEHLVGSEGIESLSYRHDVSSICRITQDLHLS